MAASQRNLTIADIARLAGVGVGTASRALNNAPGVAAATRKRVLAVADQHAYVISPDASGLAAGRTGRIGLVVPHIDRWFFGTMVGAIVSVLRAAGLDVLLYDVGDLDDRREFFEHLPARKKVDAVVVVAFPVEEAERQRLTLLGVHIVAAGGQHAVYPHACIDDYLAGRQAVDHLISLGHRAIAMIEAVDPEQPVRPSGRTAAYHRALADAGIAPDPHLVVTTNWGGVNGAEAMARLLSQSRRPTAVYAHSDEVAAGAMRTIRRTGLRIPEDISIVGIDDHPMAELLDLTTVHQPVDEQGRAAAGLVLDLLRNDTPPVDQAITLPTHLVVRRSTTSVPPIP
ncbi:MAG: LacI family DNA-binding transcriptional regulator [Propionibacterium sp.]|nr:LacI family DNA-binding transcriptional regulator [Propionibacterium sp.]